MGLSFSRPRDEQIPVGLEHSGGLLVPEGRAAALSSHPSALLCSAAAGHRVPTSLLDGGQWARGISAGGKSLSGRGRDVEGAAPTTIARGCRGTRGGAVPTPRGAGHCPQRGGGCQTRTAPAGAQGLGRRALGSCGGGVGGARRRGAGASRPAELVLLSPPVAHPEQKFRGCPGTDATPGCQRESGTAASQGNAACRCPGPSLSSPTRC